MTIKKKMLSTLVGATLALTTLQAQAVTFSGVIIFGDSLSDGGFYAGGPLPANFARFTTNPGKTGAEMLADYYNQTTTPSNRGGLNFAQGGQTAGSNLPGITPQGAQDRPISKQVSEYLTRTGGKADPDALYSMWAGANDIFVLLQLIQVGQIKPDEVGGLLTRSANEMVGNLVALKKAGARYFVVYTLPDIGGTPQFGGTPFAGTVTTAAAGFNTALFVAIKSTGIQAIPVDAFTLVREIMANPAPYGITNVKGTACDLTKTNGSSLGCNPGTYRDPNAAQTYLFADGVHPTTAAHRILADFVISMIEAPAAMSLLPETALRTRESSMRAMDQGIATAMTATEGKWVPFVNIDSGKYNYSGTAQTASGVNTDQTSFQVGFAMRATENIAVGVSLGRSKGEASFGGNLGGFNVSDGTIGAFGGYKNDNGFYGSVRAAIGDVSFNGITRNIKLGQATRVASANAGGSNFSFTGTAGYDAKLGNFTIGPFVSIATQNVDVNNFDESGAGAANLSFERQVRKSKVATVGFKAHANFGMLQPYVRVTMDKDQANGDAVVTATPVSFSTGVAPSYSIPGYKGDTSYGTGTLGLTAKFAPNIAGNIAYSTVFGRSGVKADAITANVAFGF